MPTSMVTLNISQYSKIFKGTYLTKLPPKIRGFFNRQLTKWLFTKEASYSITATKSISKMINE